MKTLTQHTIIYDHECPMCHLYTGAFLKTGMLDAKGRMAFSELVDCSIPNLDIERAKSEIALVNRQDNTVIYGVESLTTIIGHRFPFFKPLFRTLVFQFLIRHFYLFISYNRKEIAPGNSFEPKNACIPQLNYGYRGAYLIFTWLMTSLILFHYSKMLVPWLPDARLSRELLICGGQILFQGWIVYKIKPGRWMHYLGNVMTISMGGALLLLPMLWISRWWSEPRLALGYFALVVGLMFLEHIRRVKLLEFPWFVTGTWVLYRIIVLLIIQ